MNDQRIAEICEKTDQIRAIYDGYNVLNYGQLVEHINYLLSIVEKLNAQLKETRLERNRQEADKNYYKKQLAESQRREKAAVEDFFEAVKLVGCGFTLTDHDFHKINMLREKWRGPVDEKGERSC